MKSALEVLFLRRPVIEYVSPSICEVDFSSSGVPVIVLDPLSRLGAPSGLVIGGGGNSHRFSWNNYPGVLCYSVYKLVDELDPFGPYMLIAECISDNFIDLDEEGTYRITAITPDGETPLSDPFHVTFPVPPPPEEVTIELVELDNAYDLAVNAKVIAGDVGGFAGHYKNGAVVVTHISSDEYGFWNSVSPNGRWLTGGFGVSGVDYVVAYDLVAADLNTVTSGDTGFDVSDDGFVFTNLNKIYNGSTHALVATVSIPVGQTIHDPNNGSFNNAHQVAVQRAVGTGIYRWTASVNTSVAPADYGVNNTTPTILKINDVGYVAASYNSNIGANQTLFFDGASSVNIGGFGGFVTVYALAPNTGWVVGQADNGFSFYTAFRWSPDNAIEFLPTLLNMDPGSTGVANDVNDAGWIVGTMNDRAFVYHDGVTIELKDLLPPDSGWTTLQSALFINNLKQVVGYGTKDGIGNRLFIMQLV
jgi:hypothetical protein